MNPIVESLGKEYLNKELPELNPGDTVKVFVRIVEGNKERTRLSKVQFLRNVAAALVRLSQLEKSSKALALNVCSLYILHVLKKSQLLDVVMLNALSCIT